MFTHNSTPMRGHSRLRHLPLILTALLVPVAGQKNVEPPQRLQAPSKQVFSDMEDICVNQGKLYGTCMFELDVAFRADITREVRRLALILGEFSMVNRADVEQSQSLWQTWQTALCGAVDYQWIDDQKGTGLSFPCSIAMDRQRTAFLAWAFSPLILRIRHADDPPNLTTPVADPAVDGTGCDDAGVSPKICAARSRADAEDLAHVALGQFNAKLARQEADWKAYDKENEGRIAPNAGPDADPKLTARAVSIFSAWAAYREVACSVVGDPQYAPVSQGTCFAVLDRQLVEALQYFDVHP